MEIYGPAHLHGPQPLGPPHVARTARTGPAQQPGPIRDELHISDAARAAEMLADVPDVRHGRVAEIRAQIAAGTYETPEKLDVALERLLNEIG